MTDIKAVRIVQNQHASDITTISGVEIPSAFSGYGAKEYGGRWNNKGTPVVYTSGSQALAILEVAVHIGSQAELDNFSLIEVSFEEGLVTTLTFDLWPEDWRNEPAPASTKALGDEWMQSRDSLILQVPSVIVSDTPNYIINPYHPDMHKLQIREPIPYPIDPRLKL